MDKVYPNGLSDNEQETLRDYHPEMFDEIGDMLEEEYRYHRAYKCTNCGEHVDDCDCDY